MTRLCISLALLVCASGSLGCRTTGPRDIPPAISPGRHEPPLLPNGRSLTSGEPILRYPNGSIKALRQVKCQPDGTYVLDGSYTSFYHNGQKQLEGAFHAGFEHGTFITWYKNGAKATERTFADGKQNGTYKAWDLTGHKTWQVRYLNDRPHGPFVSYYPNGQKRSQGTCVNGKQHGLFVLYDQSGEIIRVTRYVHGVKQAR